MKFELNNDVLPSLLVKVSDQIQFGSRTKCSLLFVV